MILSKKQKLIKIINNAIIEILENEIAAFDDKPENYNEILREMIKILDELPDDSVSLGFIENDLKNFNYLVNQFIKNNKLN
jgi:RIO-like serine/threonine protein kinase